MTPREREVLVGLTEGGTNKSIGQKLGISPRTVELHRAQVMNRLNASTLTELQIALAAGIAPSSGIARSWYCQQKLFSLCDCTHPKPELQESMFGYPTAGIYGYTHAFGGYAGSHAEYVRVPHADVDCFQVPDGVGDEQALFLSDAAPTGYMTQVDSALEVLKEMTGGRGPDACIDAVGMEAHGTRPQYAFDRVKQSLRLETDRAQALREAIMACRKGGTLAVLGVYGLIDKFPMGVIMNKGLTVRTAQQHGQGYMDRLLSHAAKGELDPSFLATHRMSLEDSPKGYAIFKHKQEGCVRAVFSP